jgi:integrase
MKASREHIVPLDERLAEVWNEMVWRAGEPRGNGRLFPISDTAMRRLACKVAGKRITVHGFRSSFRDWCSETGVRRELAEAALAHVVGNKTEAAYNRTALVEQRRPIMEAWTAFVYADTILPEK